MALLVWCLLIFSATGILGEAATIESSSGDLQDNTLARLAKLEAKLDTVLEKNAELEERIEVLESENKRLYELTTADNTLATVDDSTPVANEDTNHNVREPSLRRSGIQQRHVRLQARRDKIQRLLLSDEATVGFTATLTTPSLAHLGPAQTIVFDHVITNIGNAYSNVTGIFTAPLSGVYVFSYNSMVEPGDQEYVDLMLNGKRVLQNYASAEGDSHHNSNSRTVVLQVDQGVSVWINHEAGSGTVHGYEHSSFAGWLIAITE